MPNIRYFLIGDLLANISSGVVAALCCLWLISPGWPMLIAMLIAMALGMFVSMLLAVLVFIRFFGAMEVMLPTMISGMIAGMVVGMRGSMAYLGTADTILYGAFIGLAVVALCWAANSRLQLLSYKEESS